MVVLILQRKEHTEYNFLCVYVLDAWQTTWQARRIISQHMDPKN